MNLTLAPLLNAPPAIQIHAVAAMAAFALALGWIWVGLMVVVSITDPSAGDLHPCHVAACGLVRAAFNSIAGR